MEAIDGALLALTLGATFVARSFSGDKDQLVPIIQAGIAHRGFAFVDVISPCVTFNDHEGSTKSYAYTREHNVEVVQADFVPPAAGDHRRLRGRHGEERDDARRQLGEVPQGGDGLRPDQPRRAPTNTSASSHRKGEVATGLLYHLAGFEGRARPERHRARARSTTCRTISSARAMTRCRS